MTELLYSIFCTNYYILANFIDRRVTWGGKIIIKSVSDLGYSIDNAIDGVN